MRPGQIENECGSGFAALVDGAIGPEGSIYVLEFGGELYRIAYEGFGVAVESETVPTKCVIHQNYPNPFRTETIVACELSTAAHVTITVDDVHGRLIAEIADDWRPAGSYEVSFDATGLSSGVYFYRLTAGEFVQTRRMAVVR